MLKKMLEVMAVGLVIAVVAGIYFRLAGALPVSVTQTQKLSTFDVMGEGKVVVVPDEAVIMLGVSEQGRNLKFVQEQVNAKMTQISARLKELGIDAKDIKTTAYNYYPDYQDAGLYRATASVAVTVRDLEAVSPALDLVSSLGLDSVSGPTFGLSDDLRERTTREAREMAIDKAKAKAAELAGLSGMSLGRIVNVQEGSNYYPSEPYMVRDALPIAGGGEVGKTVTPVEAGSNEVSVAVTLSYETR